jgi:hypothetical protein
MGTMAIPLLSPSALLELGRYAAGQVLESAASLATVPVRALALLGQAELLVSRITVLTEQAEALVQRVGAVADEAQAVAVAAAVAVEGAAVTAEAANEAVEQARAVAGEAAAVVGQASAVTGQAGAVVGQAEAISGAAAGVVARAAAAATETTELLDGYAPTLREAAPLAARFVSELSVEEVSAAIRMVDELPRLREHLIDDVMPLLGKLDQVGPDLHKLLEVTEDLHLAIAGLPGLRMLRRRGEDRVAEETSS